MTSIFQFDEFVGGFPMKSEQATKDTMDGKAFRLGYQSAQLNNDRAKLDQDRALFEQEKAAALQQLLTAQAQASSLMGAQAGAVAGLSAGLGQAGIPVDQNGMIGAPMPPMGGAPADMMGGGMPMGGSPMDMMAGMGQAPGAPMAPPMSPMAGM